MAAGDEETCTRLDTLSDGHFIRCFIAPAATRFGYRHCRKLVFLDGTFIKSQYKMILLVAATIDGENKTLPLAWEIVPTENIEHWTWFLAQFSECFAYLTEETDLVIISNRDKSIAQGVEVNLLQATHGHCCQHLADNIQHRYGLSCHELFWPIAYVSTRRVFLEALKKLQEVNVEAAQYFKKIPACFWATYAFSYPRYGHLTSNVVESINAQWLDARDLPIFHLLTQLWLKSMSKFYERF